MKKTLILTIFFVLLLSSCQSQDGQIIIKQQKHELPLKILLIRKGVDSTYAQLMIPQKIELKNEFNNSVAFSTLQFSLKGSDIFSFKNPMVYEFSSDTLEYTPAKKRVIGKKTSKIYKLYIGYNYLLDSAEIERLLEGSRFSQKRKGKDIFDIDNFKINLEFFKNKIPDSIRGYIHLNYTNPETDQFDYLNIPVKF